jgi:hypothetical protein
MFRTSRFSSLFVLLAVVSIASLPAAPAHADTLNAPVTGVLDDGSTFAGTFRVDSFKKQGNNLVARGLLIGTITNADGVVTDVISKKNVKLPVENITAETDGIGGAVCDILHLEVGPIDLELLGLIVHLDEIVLDIDADPDAGILGDLLCSIADGFGGGLLGQITNLLNDILDILEGL